MGWCFPNRLEAGEESEISYLNYIRTFILRSRPWPTRSISFLMRLSWEKEAGQDQVRFCYITAQNYCLCVPISVEKGEIPIKRAVNQDQIAVNDLFGNFPWSPLKSLVFVWNSSWSFPVLHAIQIPGQISGWMTEEWKGGGVTTNWLVVSALLAFLFIYGSCEQGNGFHSIHQINKFEGMHFMLLFFMFPWYTFTARDVSANISLDIVVYAPPSIQIDLGAILYA